VRSFQIVAKTAMLIPPFTTFETNRINLACSFVISHWIRKPPSGIKVTTYANKIIENRVMTSRGYMI
jgi:hypothetical protein